MVSLDTVLGHFQIASRHIFNWHHAVLYKYLPLQLVLLYLHSLITIFLMHILTSDCKYRREARSHNVSSEIYGSAGPSGDVSNCKLRTLETSLPSIETAGSENPADTCRPCQRYTSFIYSLQSTGDSTLSEDGYVHHPVRSRHRCTCASSPSSIRVQ